MCSHRTTPTEADSSRSLAFAEDQLTPANRTAFDIAAEDVQLALRDAAVMTGTTICSPVFLLLAVSNAIDKLAPDLNLARLWLVLLTHFGISPIRAARSHM
jgi:hypothetical protein